MPGILCEHCTALCCKYIALPIEKPTDREDFDHIRWYLIHQDVSVFVEDGDWYIAFQSRCRHLQPDNRCGIYETRPQICRDYTTDNCDYHSGDYGWELHFTCAEQLDDYVRNRWRRERRGRRGGGARTEKIHAARHGAGGRRRGLRPPPLRPRRQLDLAPAATDRGGVPLPVLPVAR